MRGISTIVVVLGFALIGCSLFWAQMVGGRRAWSEEYAKAFSAGGGEEHRLKYEGGMANELAANSQSPLAEARLGAATDSRTPIDPATASADRASAEYAAAKDRYLKLRASLDNAK